MPAKLLSSAEQLSCSPEGKKNGLRSYHTSKGKILTNPCPRRPPPHASPEPGPGAPALTLLPLGRTLESEDLPLYHPPLWCSPDSEFWFLGTWLQGSLLAHLRTPDPEFWVGG